MNEELLREAMTPLSIARGRVDACLAGRGDMIVFQRLAEDLDAVAHALAASGATLDVERLEQALDVGEWPPSEYPAGYRDPRWIAELARRVAAEYARLSGDAVMEERT